MKLSIYSGLLCAMILISPAWSAKMCLKEESNPTCTITTEGNSDIIVQCGNTTFHIITFCSSDAGEEGSKKDSLAVNSKNSNNQYCWARIISPKISRWGYIAGKPYYHFVYGSDTFAVNCKSATVESLNKMYNKYLTLLGIIQDTSSFPMADELAHGGTGE